MLWAASELLKLLNSLFAALLISEVFRAGRLSRRKLVSTIVVNAFLSSHWGLLYWWYETKSLAPSAASNPTAASLHFQPSLSSLTLVAAFSIGAVALWYSRGRLGTAIVHVVAADGREGRELRLHVGVTVVVVGGLAAAMAVFAAGWTQTARVIAAVSTFGAVGFLETRRCVPLGAELSVSLYGRHLGWSMLVLLPLYPFLAVAATPALLFIVDLVEEIFPHTAKVQGFLNELIFDGTFYSPFLSVFVLTQRRCLHDPVVKDSTPLPTKAPKERQVRMPRQKQKSMAQ
eukprot:TRINITY_DN10451_c0_g1_i1.p1 TRINITY_DN10451_c0_g1~~TRINITY_DN10451_c0_g1_i1.p1  ORF type:complete len:288 (+),score=44.88 TRINITY_DN10451_c0_g1_i1:279-1142(+)